MFRHLDADAQQGVVLALGSTLFIGASFIVKKKALLRANLSGNTPAADGGYAYLRQPIWWAGLVCMILGESANFAAYAYAPAILVTPLGASTIVTSAIFARCFLGETLHGCGVIGIGLCVLGTALLVLHAPDEVPVSSVEEIWELASQPAFVAYATCVFVTVLVLVVRYAPTIGPREVWVYVLICSLVGSLSVSAVRGLGIALKLSWRGSPQMHKPLTYALLGLVAISLATQLNYLNKALDTFGTTMVSSVYYAFFTVCTVTASMIMYKDWANERANLIVTQVFALCVLLLGVHTLSSTRSSEPGLRAGLRSMLGRSSGTASRPKAECASLLRDEQEDDSGESGGAAGNGGWAMPGAKYVR